MKKNDKPVQPSVPQNPTKPQNPFANLQPIDIPTQFHTHSYHGSMEQRNTGGKK